MCEQRTRNQRQRGLSALEVLVALTLLSGGLTFSATLLVRHQRLIAEQRHYRLALDELGNQLERLTAMPARELASAVSELGPSEFAAERLPGAALRGTLQSADGGQRLTLWMTWDERREGAAPLAVSTWIYASEGDSP